MKNATPYKLDPALNLAELAKDLSHDDYFSGKHRFQPCGKLDAFKIGFVPNPAGEFVNSSYAGPDLTFAEHLTVRIAEKKIPAQVIDDHVTKQVKRIELETGRKVSRKERNSLKLGEELLGGATAECETAADAWRATKAIETHALTQFYARNI